jgi:rhodanese-related sulfurtransferase
MRYLIMCRSQTYAQRAARLLERSGITATVSRAPQGLGASGCAWCVKVSGARFMQAVGVLRRAGAPFGKLYREEEDGGYTEVGA